MKLLFARNMQARDNLELLLVSAITSLLAVRFYLYLADYPQVGGESFHIAHMLYGGLLMLAALVMFITFLGQRVQRAASLIGGIGFGVFIDELGKFITRDNDYFYKPTIGLIYAIFIILYLTFNFLTRRTRYTSAEYQLNALQQLDDAVIGDMDANEKAAILALLDKADQSNTLTQHLRTMVKDLRTVKPDELSSYNRMRRRIDRLYRRFWERRDSSRLVSAVFIVEALLFVSAIAVSIIGDYDVFTLLAQGSAGYEAFLLIGQIVSTLVASGFAIAGAVMLTRSRLRGFEWFRRATLVNLFLTEFFAFSRTEFDAIPGFFGNLLLLGALTFALSQERRKTGATVTATS